MPTIRELQEQDAERVSDLDGELFPDLCWNVYTIQKEAKLGWGLVLEYDKRVIGYALVRLDNDLADIIRIGVTETYQRLGFGRQLLQATLHQINGRTMLTVHRENRRAQKLYLTEGFIPVSMNGEGILMVREG